MSSAGVLKPAIGDLISTLTDSFNLAELVQEWFNRIGNELCRNVDLQDTLKDEGNCIGYASKFGYQETILLRVDRLQS